MRNTFILWVVVALYCPAGGAVRCCGQTVAGGPVGGMECTRIGPLGPVPKPITERFPLSDQENRGGWVKYEPMSDEFEGTELDASKWYPNNPDWLGRQPAFFWRGNVSVHDGKLHLAMRKQEVPEMPKDKGYHDYTSAAVQSKTTVLYGYFEVKAKAMNSAGSSSFWFYNRTPHLWTEIDVYELTGKGAKLDDGELVSFENKYNMHLHVFRTPEEDRHWSVGSAWVAPWRFADDYHVYGLEWDERSIKWYLAPKGDPPALPGRQKKFDRSGSPSRKLLNVSRQAHEEEIHDGRKKKPKPYEVGVQIPRCIYSEMSAESFV